MKLVRMPSAATGIATLALIIVVGGGTAFAASDSLPKDSVGSKQIRDGAVTSDKISDAAKRSLRGNTGKTGSQGPAGAPGKNGANGKNGVDGKNGADGKDGSDGLDGSNLVIPVRSLGGTWVDHSDGTDGKSSITAQGAQLRLKDADNYAGISTDALNGLTPAQISKISYTEKYTIATDNHLTAPYFKFKLEPAGGECGDTDVVYNPANQTPNTSYAGQVTTYDVTAPYSTTGVNNDPDPKDGPFAVATHSVTNGAGRDVSNDPICLTEIILGGGSDAANSTATIYDATFAGVGLPERKYVFGS